MKPLHSKTALRRLLTAPLLWLVVALSLLLLLEPHLRQLHQQRYSADTPDTTQPLWVQYVMVGFGGFRGLISEALWLRASRLQEEGRYFEQIQLAEWITALDPRAVDAWSYNSWNLAYNISAMMPRHDDRLTWVAAGISLLRDRAIPANPKAPRLYRELGWLYQNKIGDATDPAHRRYQLDLAQTIAPLLEPDGHLPATGSTARQELATHFHFDSDTLASLEDSLGYRFDWRLPQPHAIYWAWSGLPHASGFEHQALRRMIHQNLMVLVERGRFSGDLSQGVYRTAPALEVIPVTCRFFEETIALYPNEVAIYARFLAVAIGHQTRAGAATAAQESYTRLQTLATALNRTIPPFDQLAAGNLPAALLE